MSLRPDRHYKGQPDATLASFPPAQTREGSTVVKSRKEQSEANTVSLFLEAPPTRCLRHNVKTNTPKTHQSWADVCFVGEPFL